MGNEMESLDTLILELRRGTIVLNVLSQLKKPQYGYSLVQCLAEKGLEIEQGTLYPLLRRLEKQGLLDSSWQIEDSRPRRYYVLSRTGIETFNKIKTEWEDIVKTTQRLLKEDEEDPDNGEQ